jgi:hypothetical protein
MFNIYNRVITAVHRVSVCVVKELSRIHEYSLLVVRMLHAHVG